MNTLPLFFNLENRSVVIIGGGCIALRKATLIEKAKARITIIAKNICTELQELLKDKKHTLIQKEYNPNDIHSSFVFCIAATNNTKTNQAIYDTCKLKNIPINVVDTPHLCDFIFPAIVDKDPITIGISSNGNAPVLARLIRAKIESILPSHIGKLAQIAGQFRKTVQEQLPHINQRRQFWEKIFDDGLNGTGIFLNSQNISTQTLQNQLNQINPNTQTGEVYIVGAGAGSADLLTFRALQLMQQADVVLYDALVDAAVLDLCRRDSNKIFVGKKRSQHSKTQTEINELLIFYAKQGKRVLRLKGGDPFVFGRGGEEMQACQQAGIAYHVVPGITAALAAASAVGIPLTHRGVATNVRFLTTCYQTGAYFEGLQSAYNDAETLVFYMGLHALDTLTARLSEDLPKDTPVAIVACASLPNQAILLGQLHNIAQKHQQTPLPAPAVIIVGKVVALHPDYPNGNS